MTSSWEVPEKSNPRKRHVRSTCWKLKSHVRLSVLWVSREKGQFATYPRKAKLYAWRILSVTFLSFTHTIYTLIIHKSKRGYSKRKTLDKFSTTQHTHLLERELFISEKSLYLLIPSSIIIPWQEICTQTQLTHFQSVVSVLELGKVWGFVKRSRWGLTDAIGCIARSEKLEKTWLQKVRWYLELGGLKYIG